MRKLGLVTCVATALVLMAAAPAWADEIAGNGGFEIAGAGGPTTSALWSAFTSFPANVSERDAAHPASGAWAQHLKALGTDGLGTVAGITQNSVNDVGLASLQENTTLSASFDAALPFGPGGVLNYSLRILDRNGGIVAIYNNTLGAPTGLTYQTYTTQTLTVPAFGAAPNDLYAAFLEINAAAGGFAASFSEAYIDNVHITGTLVPEPTALALLSLAGLLLRRR